MSTRIYTASELAPVDHREVFRYAGGGLNDETLFRVYEDSLNELLPRLTYKVVWEEYPVSYEGDLISLTFAKIRSDALQKNLCGSSRIVLFAATLGVAPDRMSQKYSQVSPIKSLFAESIGAERVEALCDTFCKQFSGSRPRFSPGYGDLPLELQRDVIRVLDAGRKIGLTLNESLLMTPAKSVTAIVGIK